MFQQRVAPTQSQVDHCNDLANQFTDVVLSHRNVSRLEDLNRRSVVVSLLNCYTLLCLCPPIGVFEILCFTAVVSFFFFSARNLGGPSADSTKLSRVLGSECNLSNWVRDLGPLPLKHWAQNVKILDLISDNFRTRWRIISEWNDVSSAKKVRWKLQAAI